MKIKELEKQLDEYNARLLKINKIVQSIPIMKIKMYFLKKMLRVKDTRDNIFITLREETRKQAVPFL